MSMIVARMQKMKADNLIGLGNHNQRRTENHSNKDIDVERSKLNYDLVNRTDTYKTDIQKFINENKASSRAVRKDAVLVNEWIITSDRPFFNQLDENETRRFFEAAKDYFADNYGKNNIRYAQVHLDERTPHMHLGVVPLTKDKRLSAKTVFNREALQKIQNELPEYLQEKGFEIERGEEKSERKHLTVKEYKDLKEKEHELTEKMQSSEEKLDDIKDELNTLYEQREGISEEIAQKEEQLEAFQFGNNQEIEKKPVLLRKEYVTVKTNELDQLEKEASMSYVYHSQYKQIKSENDRLKRQIWRLEDDIKEIKADLGGKLERAENRLKNALEEFKERWDFAKAVVTKGLKKNLGEMYEAFKEHATQTTSQTNKQEDPKQEKRPAKREKDELSL